MYRTALRLLSTGRTAAETRMSQLLSQRFPQAKEIRVEDVSSGCGAMYNVYVKSGEFKGMSKLQQHKSITNTLKEEIKDMHGLQIVTEVHKA